MASEISWLHLKTNKTSVVLDLNFSFTFFFEDFSFLFGEELVNNSGIRVDCIAGISNYRSHGSGKVIDQAERMY